MASEMETESVQRSGVLLGEDWMRADASADREARQKSRKTGVISLNRSPLARKIIIFNLLAILMLVAGVLILNPFRDSLVFQREAGLVAETELVADVFEAQLVQAPGARLGQGLDAEATIAALDLFGPSEVFVFDAEGSVLGTSRGLARSSFSIEVAGHEREGRSTILTDVLDRVWMTVARLLEKGRETNTAAETQHLANLLVERALGGGTHVETNLVKDGSTVFAVATPIMDGAEVIGAVALTSGAGEIDELVRAEREQVLQMFIVAIVTSVGLSLVLASTIANPLADLAAAAEIGRDRNARSMSPGRVRIPDLSARPDEIGRLSSALRGMVAALYDRIDANEQFAADVAHEIKNPLASLRSAVGSLRFVKKDEQRDKLLDVIDHDVRRLDRLVSDISNASRLDSELVTEEEESFNLLGMLTTIGDYLGRDADAKGITFITDLPSDPILIDGLESRLAQVFVNLISNAISFCDEGDAIRLWARRRDNRVLVVVEDTGPGIPDSALTRIFDRFYSERPEGQFGNNSGLGLAISKQIVEAHGGVIWAENIKPTDADPTSEPLGARFVVGLPV
ncbi:two-component system, OmpR family, sensor histidine kinase ChvG [Palleronia marisminoris]|uniref:histidine kinase n=1 Tax=Palleronia marisminoris TaxID=315423 RepID=A0A1Y5T8D8_9RHOB|nr:two-component system, OmpR family, sensor histidine kinase ChvG [Palleronia marisminoris]SLN56113.1 Alkaline phosphatase synthesis sensor protein PhoR [Palleronia marisminoris]